MRASWRFQIGFKPPAKWTSRVFLINVRLVLDQNAFLLNLVPFLMVKAGLVMKQH